VPTEEQTAEGLCPNHGEVEATRDIPKMQFPFVVYAILRARARRKPYRCPTCGEAVEVE
jgi:predicted RNA-binding Zn-ribbon protein involved in translation (DUF1610 family)